MIFSAVPLATVGGVVFLWMRGMPFSVSAGIGFIALFGIAVLNGIVLIEHLKELKQEGVTNMRELILTGTRNRLRPVMLTAAAAALGFLPMAISSGAGAEVQRPLATVVIGGLITSTLLTMIALPLLFEIFNNVIGIQLWPLKVKRKETIAVLLFFLLFPAFTSMGQTKALALEDAIGIAVQNNRELKTYALKVQESQALRPAALTIDKTLVYYGYDQNNIAENGYPLKVIGLEQSFNFPTVYAAQSKANVVNVTMAETELIRQKQMLIKDVSQAYYEIQYLLNKQQVYLTIDSLYRSFETGSAFRYSQGDISQLDLLNAKAKQQQINANTNELRYNLNIAHQNLQTLIQYDSVFEIPFQPLKLLEVKEISLESTPGMQLMKIRTTSELALLRVERNRLFPDLSLSYFIGSNSYGGARKYQGFMVGLSLPLFFGEQQAKINAGKISVNINETLHANELARLRAKHAVLLNQLMKYRESVDLYNKSGKQLSEEILRASQRSYSLGEIDFFQFVLSIENALALTLNYYENISKHNQIALEINYLTN
jgi:cobalt-zinc-cadmium resistance protein CzcA